MQDVDLRADFMSLGWKLEQVLADLADPKVKASGSDAASLARTRRIMGDRATDDRLAELQSDYDLLGRALALSSGSGAAAVANERRMIRKALSALRSPEGVSKVASLESFRRTRAEAAGPSTRRRQSR